MGLWRAFTEKSSAGFAQPGSIIHAPLPAPIPEECLGCESYPDPWQCCAEVHASEDESDSIGTVFGAFSQDTCRFDKLKIARYFYMSISLAVFLFWSLWAARLAAQHTFAHLAVFI
jgi:hypothetical protein